MFYIVLLCFYIFSFSIYVMSQLCLGLVFWLGPAIIQISLLLSLSLYIVETPDLDPLTSNRYNDKWEQHHAACHFAGQRESSATWQRLLANPRKPGWVTPQTLVSWKAVVLCDWHVR